MSQLDELDSTAGAGICKRCPNILAGNYYAGFCGSCWRAVRFPQVERALRTLEAPAEQVRK